MWVLDIIIRSTVERMLSGGGLGWAWKCSQQGQIIADRSSSSYSKGPSPSLAFVGTTMHVSTFHLISSWFSLLRHAPMKMSVFRPTHQAMTRARTTYRRTIAFSLRHGLCSPPGLGLPDAKADITYLLYHGDHIIHPNVDIVQSSSLNLARLSLVAPAH